MGRGADTAQKTGMASRRAQSGDIQKKNIPSPGPQRAGCGLPWPRGGGPSSQAEDESWAGRELSGPVVAQAMGHGADKALQWGMASWDQRASACRPALLPCSLQSAWAWTAQNWNCLKNVIKSHCQNHTTALHFPIHLCCFFLWYQRSLWARMKQIFAALLISGPTQKDRGEVRAHWHANLLKRRWLLWEELLYSPPLQSQHMGFSAVCTYCFIKEVRFCYFYKISTVWIYKFIAFLNCIHTSLRTQHNHALAPKVGQEDPSSSPSSQTPAAFSCPTVRLEPCSQLLQPGESPTHNSHCLYFRAEHFLRSLEFLLLHRDLPMCEWK